MAEIGASVVPTAIVIETTGLEILLLESFHRSIFMSLIFGV